MGSQRVQVDKKQIWGKVRTAHVLADVSARCCATSRVSVLMLTVAPCALEVPALAVLPIRGETHMSNTGTQSTLLLGAVDSPSMYVLLSKGPSLPSIKRLLFL